MFSKPLAFFLLALGCVTAAGGGAYLATRHNSADLAVTASPAAAPAVSPAAATAAQPASQPVAETEAAVSAAKPEAAVPSTPKKAESAAVTASARHSTPAPQTSRKNTGSGSIAAPVRAQTAPRTVPLSGSAAAQPDPQPAPAATAPGPDPVKPIESPEPAQPQFEDVILPAGSIIGLQLETPLSSERARVEDRVEARVTRDVIAAGRVAIPATSRVLGSVTAVEKGGKVKQPARLAIRFHTLILADGSEVALHTDPIDRTGESPTNSSAKKIGGGAVGGAILGAILGGGKGAAIGGATGAAGGTAMVMSGERAAVSLTPGSLLNARLSAPATITVERRDR
jgi:hypothetical protein